jgi:hypothetical protein
VRVDDRPPTDRSDAVLGVVRRRDELLSLLYWLRADQISEVPGVDELAPFLGAAPLLQSDLDSLADAGLLQLQEQDGQYRVQLTPAGVDEAKRRFEEEFRTPTEQGVAGNAHEVMVGVCGPNAKCVKDGLHGECAEPEIAFPLPGREG